MHGTRSIGAKRRFCLILLLLAALAGCVPAPAPDRDASVVIFALDSPMDVGFVHGRPVGLRASDVTHGSLVGRVLLSYCRATVMSVPVEDLEGRPSKSAYLEGLRTVARYVREHPDAKVLVNISLASDVPDAEEEELIGRITDAGALVIAAAGNDDSDAPLYPAAYADVIAVASATRKGKALASNFGPHIDIAASGDIAFIDYEFLPYERLRWEMEARGTSFAAPRVTGTLACLMRHDPGLSPHEAYRILESTARPIEDRYHRGGALGAGLLDVYRAKSLVWPSYRFVHFILPVCIWIVLGVLSAYLCVRYELVGVFLTLMIWLVGLPASVLLILNLANYLELVGGGSIVLGLGVVSVFAAAAAVAAAVQQWHVPKTAVAMLPPFVVFLVLGAGGVIGHVGQMSGALAAAAVGVGTAVLLEAMTRRKLRFIRALPEAAGVPAASELLVRVYARALDGRVQNAVLEALGRVGDETAVEFLLREHRHAEAAVDSLVRIASASIEGLVPWLRRFPSLSGEERERLTAALERAGDLAAVPYLEEIVASGGFPEAARLLEALKARWHTAD